MFLLKFKISKFRQKNKCDKRKLFIYVLNELTDKKNPDFKRQKPSLFNKAL